MYFCVGKAEFSASLPSEIILVINVKNHDTSFFFSGFFENSIY